MGELRNCPVCGKVFVKVVKNLCPACVEAEEQEFMEARDYIKNNPGASVEEITTVTKIDEKKILKWLREGRIDYSNRAGGLRPTCKSCGATINVGNLCAKCAKELSNRIHSITASGQGADKPAQEGKDDQSKRMYVANRIRKE